jgi:hypothetical protein
MTNQKKIWITYSWDDNDQNNIDFYAQELKQQGLDVYLDRYTLSAGQDLWQQIENYIKGECDAWIYCLSQSSIISDPCLKEYFFAIEKTRQTRGENFPIIFLFPTTYNEDLIPQKIKNALYVSIVDSDWKERIKAAVEGRKPNVNPPFFPPYIIELREQNNKIYISISPRVGVWKDVFVGIPAIENERVKIGFSMGSVSNFGIYEDFGLNVDNKPINLFALVLERFQATATNSVELECDTKPSKIFFGDINNKQKPQLYNENLT